MSVMRASILVALTALVALGGCANRDGSGPKLFSGAKRSNAASSDVVRVVCFYTANMWRSFDEAGDRNPEGFAFVMYLWSRNTGRGIYADGRFRTQMYRVERDEAGAVTRELAHEWVAATADLPKRGESRLGYSYQPSLYWGELDVYGVEVEIVVIFEAPDGRVVQSQTHRTKVPQRKA